MFINFIYWQALIEYLMFMEIRVFSFFKIEMLQYLSFSFLSPNKEVQSRPDRLSRSLE